mmetsp:Transcript_38750/g.115237  ORF Transcript_38750/g.115237 Transcript_38750/m.115237 type:complete len:103 (-) Transcript_38750:19-327(-)
MAWRGGSGVSQNGGGNDRVGNAGGGAGGGALLYMLGTTVPLACNSSCSKFTVLSSQYEVLSNAVQTNFTLSEAQVGCCPSQYEEKNADTAAAAAAAFHDKYM